MNIVSIITIITTIVSILGFRNPDIFQKLMLSPYKVFHDKDYHRIVTHGFLHADWFHLIINMVVFISFGEFLLSYFNYYFGINGTVLFLVFYLLSIVVSSAYSIYQNKNNSAYGAIGASGAVSAVVFAAIFFEPLQKIALFGVLPMPGIVYALAYLSYSYYMSKKSYDNIGHDAHFFGAVFGIIFPILVKPYLLEVFFHKLTQF